MIKYKAKRMLPLILFASIGGAYAFGALISIILFAMDLGFEGTAEVSAACAIVAIISIAVAFTCGYCNIKTYVFAEDDITVFRGKKQIWKISRSEIREIRFVSLSANYFLNGMTNNKKGVCNTLYIFPKEGKTKLLLWTNKNLAQQLQSELYGKLVCIYD